MVTCFWSLSCQGQPEPHFYTEAWLHVTELRMVFCQTVVLDSTINILSCEQKNNYFYFFLTD